MKDQSVYVFPSAHFVQKTNSNVYEALNDSNGVTTLACCSVFNLCNIAYIHVFGIKSLLISIPRRSVWKELVIRRHPLS